MVQLGLKKSNKWLNNKDPSESFGFHKETGNDMEHSVKKKNQCFIFSIKLREVVKISFNSIYKMHNITRQQ